MSVTVGWPLSISDYYTLWYNKNVAVSIVYNPLCKETLDLLVSIQHRVFSISQYWLQSVRKNFRYIGWDNALNQSINKKTEIFRQLVLDAIKLFLYRKIKSQIHKRSQIFSPITLVTILLPIWQILHWPVLLIPWPERTCLATGTTQAEVTYLDLRKTDMLCWSWLWSLLIMIMMLDYLAMCLCWWLCSRLHTLQTYDAWLS